MPDRILVSTSTPAKRGGDWNGERPAWSRPSFESDNRAAARSVFYATALRASERDEVQAIADVLRELSPLEGAAQEPLVQVVAAQLWRQRAAVTYIDKVGIEEVSRSSSLLRDLSTLERSLLANLKALALTPQSAADLGLTWARTEAAYRFDWSRLTEAEQKTFTELAAKAEAAGEEWSDDAA